MISFNLWVVFFWGAAILTLLVGIVVVQNRFLDLLEREALLSRNRRFWRLLAVWAVLLGLAVLAMSGFASYLVSWMAVASRAQGVLL